MELVMNFKLLETTTPLLVPRQSKWR